MSALTTLTATEARLFLRNPTSVFMALLLPFLLLMLQGFVIPGTMEPIGGDNPAVADLRVIDFFVPISITVADARTHRQVRPGSLRHPGWAHGSRHSADLDMATGEIGAILDFGDLHLRRLSSRPRRAALILRQGPPQVSESTLDNFSCRT